MHKLVSEYIHAEKDVVANFLRVCKKSAILMFSLGNFFSYAFCEKHF